MTNTAEKQELNSEKFASAIARILDDNKAIDTTILNVSNVCSLSDYFIIATGNSTTHVRGLTETLRKKIKDLFKRLPLGDETERSNKWNLLDYGEVVVHIMHPEIRETYKIEKFWSHAMTVSKEAWQENSKEFAIYE